MDKNVLEGLFQVIKERQESPQAGSYTCYLFEQGIDKILKKCGEECSEVIIAAKGEDQEALIGEICDLTYHILVLMAQRNIELEEVMAVLEQRRQKLGNLKEFKKVDKLT